MKNLPNDLFKKIVKLSDDVKENLRRKGIVVPIENDDGSITIGDFKIVKTSQGFFNILDRHKEHVVENINLPQTAVLVANGLALGKWKDDKVIDLDQKYGYALFEEQLHKRAVEKSNKKSLEYFDLMMTKCLIARAKKEQNKAQLVQSYEKLVKLV
jgi:hypothetical protein